MEEVEDSIPDMENCSMICVPDLLETVTMLAMMPATMALGVPQVVTLVLRPEA